MCFKACRAYWLIFSIQSEMSDGTKVGSPEFYQNGDILFLYDEEANLEELHLINEKGTFLRKYRFHYNEAGYCTKKELINREGSVEFSVRFEYDYFNN
jgi:hypothetical protein